jgi:hypothetical protein
MPRATACALCGTPTDAHPAGPVNGIKLAAERPGWDQPYPADRGDPPDFGAYVPLTDRCLACLFAEEKAIANGVQQIVAGARAGADIWCIECLPGHVIREQWRDYSALVFGRRVERIPPDHHIDTRGFPWFAHYWDEGGAIVVIQAWLRRVRFKDTPLYIEQRWNPAMPRATRALRGLEDDESPRHRQAALRGEQLLVALDQSGWARFDNADECKAAVETWILNALRQGRKLRREDAEFELCNIRSEGRQLARYLEPAYKWSDLKSAVRRSHPDLLS